MIELSQVRCLSIRQPWADAILCGLKRVENRTWTTDYRGIVLIHAGSNKSILTALEKEISLKFPDKKVVLGALIGCAELVSVEPMSAELESDPWSSGPYCWKFENPHRFTEAIVSKGRLQLYPVDASLNASLTSAFSSAVQREPHQEMLSWFEALANHLSGERRQWTLLSNYFSLRDAENALRVAEASVKSNCTVETLSQRGFAKELGGDHSGALKDAEAAMALDPSDYRPHLLAKFAHEHLGNNKEADDEYRRARELGYVDEAQADEEED